MSAHITLLWIGLEANNQRWLAQHHLPGCFSLVTYLASVFDASRRCVMVSLQLDVTRNIRKLNGYPTHIKFTLL